MRPTAVTPPESPTRIDAVLYRVQLLLLAILAAAILISAAEPAQAALHERHDPAGQQVAETSYDVLGLSVVAGEIQDLDDEDDGEQWEGEQLVSGWDSKNLPIFRWLEASSTIKTRINGQDLTSISARMSQGQVVDMMMSAGNMPFHVTTFMTQAATELDIINVAGYQIDQFFASVAEAMLSSGLVGFVIVISIGVAVWQIARRLGRGGGNPLVTLTKPLLLVTIFGIFLAGSTASSESGPGAGSPWWVAQKTNAVVSALTAAPAAALVASELDAGYNWADDPDADDLLSCQTYVDTMRETYQNENSNYASSMSRSMPLVLSGMWELTGLPTYANAQFGHNQYSTHIFCRGLDENARLSAEQRIEHNPGTEQADPNEVSWPFSSGNDTAWNVNMMHWSACRYDGEKFSLKSEWEAVPDVRENTQEVCSDWWDTPAHDYDLSDSPVNITANAHENDALSDVDADLYSFIYTTQGFDGASNTMAVMIFVIVAWVISLVFGVVAITVFVAKVGMIFALFGLVFGLIVDILPTSGESRLKEYLVKFIGMAFVAGFAQLIFAIIIAFTSIIMKIGQGLVGGNDALMMVWAGLSPVAAAYLLHWIFKKFLKKPSPVTIGGARAWAGNMANGAGMLSSLNSLRNSHRIDDLAGNSHGREMRGQPGMNSSAVGRGQGENSGGHQMAPAGARPEANLAAKKPAISPEAAHRRKQIGDAYQQMRADDRAAAGRAAMEKARQANPDISDNALAMVGRSAESNAAVVGGLKDRLGATGHSAKLGGQAIGSATVSGVKAVGGAAADGAKALGHFAKSGVSAAGRGLRTVGDFGQKTKAVHASAGGGLRGLAIASGSTIADAARASKNLGRIGLQTGLGVARTTGNVGKGVIRAAAPSSIAGGLRRAGGNTARGLSNAIQHSREAHRFAMESYQSKRLEQSNRMPVIQPLQPGGQQSVPANREAAQQPAAPAPAPAGPPPAGGQTAPQQPQKPASRPSATGQGSAPPPPPVQGPRVAVAAPGGPAQTAGPSMQAGARPGDSTPEPRPAPTAKPQTTGGTMQPGHNPKR